MIIIKTDYLTDDMLDSITDLVLDVNEADNVKYAVPDDADYYALMYDDNEKEVIIPEEVDADELDPDALMGFIALYEMGETHDNETVVELSAFTAPKHRRKGCFKTLLSSLSEELSDFAVRFAVYEGTSNLEALKKTGAEYDHDELMMALMLSDAELTGNDSFKADIEIETVHTEEGDYEEGKVTTPYGECFFKLYGPRAYVFGILTYESKRRMGYASSMLRQLFNKLKELGMDEVTLEVSSANKPAKSLYDKLGFRTMDRLSYHYMIK